MRHGKKFNHLGRKTAHRKAMLANMASSLIIHKRIRTTVAKAKALRKFIEPLVTKSKNDTTHNRRVVFSYLRDKEAMKELFGPVASAVANRPGGYTRILKIGNRAGDNAEMAMMEFVDFNELAPGKVGGEGSGKSRRRRRGKKKATGAAESTAAAATTEAPSVMEKVADVASDVKEAVEDVVEDVVDKVEDVVEDVADAVEDAVEDIVGDDDDKEKDA
ncbi:MAG: 50S ribosomal protein L17 [Bacteroidia bacterium]